MRQIWASALVLGASACFIGCSESGDGGGAASGGGNTSQAGTSNGSGGSSSGGSKTGQAGSSNGGAGKATGGSNDPPVTDFPDAQVYVDAHNAVRAAVEKPANYSGTWQPLPPVTWSDEVALTAQQWAEHLRDTMNCGLEHASDTGYGENLAGGSNLDAQGAVALWANEKDNYTYSSEYVFSGNIGHYTQIVWRSSVEIGCGKATCGRSSVIACRYKPPGNFIGGEIF